MSEQDKKILDKVASAIRPLDENGKERFLTFAEGMALMAQMRDAQDQGNECNELSSETSDH